MPDIYGPVDAVYKTMYADNVALQVQVLTNPFEQSFTPIANLKGREMQAVELVGKEEMDEDLPGSTPTPLKPSSHEGIYVQPRRGTWGKTIPVETDIKAAVDYSSAYVRTGAAAAARHRAKVINRAIAGPRLIKNDNTGAINVVPFDWANRSVAANYQYGGGGASQGFTVPKLVKAVEKLGITDLDVDMEDIWCAITMKENTDLYNDIKYINTQYAGRAKFGEKTVREFMGIKFRIYNSLPKDPTGQWTAVPVWARSGIHYGEAYAANNIDRDPGLQFQVVMFNEQWIAATRSEDEKVAVVYSDPAFG